MKTAAAIAEYPFESHHGSDKDRHDEVPPSNARMLLPHFGSEVDEALTPGSKSSNQERVA